MKMKKEKKIIIMKRWKGGKMKRKKNINNKFLT